MIRSFHIVIITMLGILATAYYATVGVDIHYWVSALFFYFIFSCLGVTVTFHRYLTHNSFRFKHKLVERLFILFGSLAGTGSAIGWVAVHRTHHVNSDKPGDPHGPATGWRNFFNDYDDDVNYRLVKNLLKDRFLKTMHKYGILVILLYYAVLFALGGINAVMFFGIIPQMLTVLISASCNYFSHLYGYRSYNTEDESKNTWWLAIPTWGDSWHNNHHAKPWLYSFKHQWWEFDISGIIIEIIRDKNVRKNI
jgi:fatty-acid desaturase